MAIKFVILACVVAVAHAGVLAPVAKLVVQEPSAPAEYSYSYDVHDEVSGDIKSQQETRHGDDVTGSYMLVEADGTRRIVEYTASAEHGFQAVVRHEGEPRIAPVKVAYATPTPVAYAAPVAKLAYAAPVTKVTHSAPIAYAAPIKVAYTAPIAKVSYPAPAAYAVAPVSKLAYPAPAAQVAYAGPAVTKVTYTSPVAHYLY